MKVSISLDDRAFRRWLQRLEKQLPGTLDTVAKTLAAQGREYARDIVTVMIYATPERGGYRRTRQLIRSIYGANERRGSQHRVVIGASVGYAPYNEFGTYDGYAGDDVAADEILAAARDSNARLITLEYGRVESGLEPRPFIIPAIVMVEREAPAMLAEAVRRLAGGR